MTPIEIVQRIPTTCIVTWTWCLRRRTGFQKEECSPHARPLGSRCFVCGQSWGSTSRLRMAFPNRILVYCCNEGSNVRKSVLKMVDSRSMPAVIFSIFLNCFDTEELIWSEPHIDSTSSVMVVNLNKYNDLASRCWSDFVWLARNGIRSFLRLSKSLKKISMQLSVLVVASNTSMADSTERMHIFFP